MSRLFRRVGLSLLQLLVLSALIHAIFRVAPGDFYTSDLSDPRRSPQSVDALRTASGSDRPWPVQYADWIGSALRGDFGTSLAYGVSVSSLIGGRLNRTLQLALPALVLAWIAGLSGALLPVGRRWFAWLDPGVAAAAMIPDIVSVSILLWAAVWLGMPVTGRWLPFAGLLIGIVPLIFLHASGAVREAENAEFVRIVRTRGVSGAKLWLHYILPAAANPLLSLAGLSLAAAIGSAFVVEVLTGWPGIGPLFLDAVQARDIPIVQTVLMFLATLLALGNLAADLLLYRLDPRIRVS